MPTRYRTDDLRIADIREVSPPSHIHAELPLTEAAARTTFEARNSVRQVLHGEDDRLMVVIGPCSIHDPAAALDYGSRLRAVATRLAGDLVIVMRVYFEKPRTTVGWKGLINDPDLDGSFHVDRGLRHERRLLLDLNDAGIPAGVEYLDPFTPQYLSDLVAWGAIGARTTESQVHREMASGLSSPVGFKNGTDGNVAIAVDAVRAARHPHRFLGVTKTGHCAICTTTGNEDCHIILRGGREPNYDAASVDQAAELLDRAGLSRRLMIDFSHANSRKLPARQIEVGADIAARIAAGEDRVFGVMVESHLVAGRQDVVAGKPLVYGQSITDACIGWEDSERLLESLAAAVRRRRGAARPRSASAGG